MKIGHFGKIMQISQVSKTSFGKASNICITGQEMIFAVVVSSMLQDG